MSRIPLARRAAGAALLAVIAGGGLAACSDDDGGTASAETPRADFDSEACDAFAGLTSAFVGDPTAAGTDADALVDATADSDLASAAQAVADAFAAAATDESALGSPEFSEAWSAVGDAAFDSCETETSFEVRGIDYAFSGLPAEVPAGRVAVRFTNDSQTEEPHELVLVRRLPGVDTPVGELLQLPPEELFGSVEMAGVLFVEQPAARASALLDLEAGEYVAVCMLPTAGDETDPHAGHGMVTEFEVVA